MTEIDNLELSHLMELMERKREKLEEERQQQLLEGTENLFGAMTGGAGAKQ